MFSTMFRFVICFVCISVFYNQSEAYRILGVFPFNGHSHEMMFQALMKGLAKRGHQVDVITHFPVKDPPRNYKNILDLSGTLESLVNNFTLDFIMSMRDDVGQHVATTYGNRLCDLMGLEEMQKIIRNPPSDPPYDVLVTEAFGANCYMGIGHLFNIPVIAATSAVEYPWVSDFTGNNDNPAVVPNALFTAFGQMNFWQRLKNTLIYHNEVKKFHTRTEQSQTESMRKYLSPDIPNIRDVERNVALTLVNSHPILFGVKPVLPTLVQVGGLHVGNSDIKLPQNLQKWMDESEDGILYFTFGSMVLIETLPEHIMNVLLASFAKIAPTRVLMKIADKSKLPPNVPKNVLTLPWIPQQSILAHNNTRAFMTHGGLMGSQEALFFGVPMIGIPLFADQPRNVQAFVAKNMSIKLLLHDISEDTLDKALNSILFDPQYKKNAEHYSKLFRDQPLSAMDTAAFWVEYVARNGPILRSPALNLTWWQLALLDVYGCIFLVIIMTMFISFRLIKFIVKKSIFSAPNDVSIHKKKI